MKITIQDLQLVEEALSEPCVMMASSMDSVSCCYKQDQYKLIAVQTPNGTQKEKCKTLEEMCTLWSLEGVCPLWRKCLPSTYTYTGT
jgi:hypothetical protein